MVVIIGFVVCNDSNSQHDDDRKAEDDVFVGHGEKFPRTNSSCDGQVKWKLWLATHETRHDR